MPRSSQQLLLTLAELDTAIADRRRYLRETEMQIADVIDRGNSELLALNYEVRLAKQELSELKTAIRQLHREKTVMQQDVLIIQQTIVKAYA